MLISGYECRGEGEERGRGERGEGRGERGEGRRRRERGGEWIP